MHITIMGSTGGTGRAAAARLRELGVHVRALTRDAARAEALRHQGMEARCADPQDADALAEAFAGAHAVYVMVPPYLAASDAWQESARAARAIAEAVRRARCGHVVALSSGGAHLADGAGIISTLRDLEAALMAAGAPTTLLRASDFMENWRPVLDAATTSGTLPSVRVPLDRPYPTIASADIGRIAAERLLAPPPPQRCVLNLAGPEDYSPAAAAAILGRILGRPVAAVAVGEDEAHAALLAGGIAPSYAAGLVAVYRGLNAGIIGFEPGVGTLVRGSTTLDQALRGMLAGPAG